MVPRVLPGDLVERACTNAQVLSPPTSDVAWSEQVLTDQLCIVLACVSRPHPDRPDRHACLVMGPGVMGWEWDHYLVSL